MLFDLRDRAKGVGGGTIRQWACENKPGNMFRQEEARESGKPGEDGHHQVHTIGDCELRSLLIKQDERVP